MAPGVVGSAIAVVPTVDIWENALAQPSPSIATTKKKMRIANQPRDSLRSRRPGLRRDPVTISDIHPGIENDEVTRSDPFSNLHLLAEIAGDRNLPKVDRAVLDDSDVQPIFVENDRVSGDHERGGLPGNMQVDDAIDAGAQRAVRIRNVDF